MIIAGHAIGVEPFCIAETGLNHNGDVDRALEMIRSAARCGVDAVKFQTFKARDVCDEEQEYTYLSQGRTVTEKRIEIFRRCELAESAWPVLKAECDRQRVVFLSTPETPADLDILLKVGIPAIKIGSDNLTNLPMLRYCARDDVGLPIILSCGMSDAEEIVTALTAIGNCAVAALMVCTSEYPCPDVSANLRRITYLRNTRLPVGLSDHTIGPTAAATAVGLGACVFEKHFTLQHTLPGPDHGWSADRIELLGWVNEIHTAWTMLGDGVFRPTQKEREVKGKYQRRSA